MSLPEDLRAAIAEGIDMTYGINRPWLINTDKRKPRLIESVMRSLNPLIIRVLQESETRGHMRGVARSADLTLDAERRGYENGRRDALLEAATMLKRHGHRTAVDRVQALATPTAAPEPTNRPAGALRPSHDPQNGTSAPTRNTPQEALESPSEPRTPAEPSTDTATGPSAALRGRPAPAACRA